MWLCMFDSEKGLRHVMDRSWPISPLSMSAFAFVYGAYQFRWAGDGEDGTRAPAGLDHRVGLRQRP